MDLNDLTVREVNEFISLFSNAKAESAPHPFVGKYVIARCYSAGVHAGEVVSVDGDNVILKNSRRLWSWKAGGGIALSGVAQFGVVAGSKLDAINPLIYLASVCELIPVAEGVERAITSYVNG